MRGPHPLRGLFPPLPPLAGAQGGGGSSGNGSSGGGQRSNEKATAAAAAQHSRSASTAGVLTTRGSRSGTRTPGGGPGAGGSMSTSGVGSACPAAAAPPSSCSALSLGSAASRDRSGFSAASSSPPPSVLDTEHISVVVRVRPLSEKEAARGEGVAVEVDEDGRTVLTTPPPSNASSSASTTLNSSCSSSSSSSSVPATPRAKAFPFAAAIPPQASQAATFAAAGVGRLLDAAVAGYAVTVLAYGQTGSGKTYTMCGREGEAAPPVVVPSSPSSSSAASQAALDSGDGPSSSPLSLDDGSTAGIIARSVAHLFARVAEASAADGASYLLRASAAELYNEQLYDLLCPNPSTPPPPPSSSPSTSSSSPAPPADLQPPQQPLQLKWDAERGFHAQGLREVPCATPSAALAALAAATAARRTGGHALNAQSSRSHAVFTLHVDCVPAPLPPAAANEGSKGGRAASTAGAPSEKGARGRSDESRSERRRAETLASLDLRNGSSSPPSSSATSAAVRSYGRAIFVDLAGSERVGDSGSAGGMLRETGAINKSLFALGKVISALSVAGKREAAREAAAAAASAAASGASTPSGSSSSSSRNGGIGALSPSSFSSSKQSQQNQSQQQNQPIHIPYRDSKLTKLLMDSLGGGGLALMIACVSPAAGASDESFATLSYAARAASVRTRGAAPRVDPSDAAAASLRREVLLLRAENVYLRGQLLAAGGGGGGSGIGGIGGVLPLSGSKTPGGGGAGTAYSLVATPGSVTPVRSKLLLSSSLGGSGVGVGGVEDEWGELGAGVFGFGGGIGGGGGGGGTERPPSPEEGESGAKIAPGSKTVPASARTSGDGSGGGGGGGDKSEETRPPSHRPVVLAPRALARALADARSLAARFAADNAGLAAEARALRARRAAVDADYRGALDELDELRERLDAIEAERASAVAVAGVEGGWGGRAGAAAAAGSNSSNSSSSAARAAAAAAAAAASVVKAAAMKVAAAAASTTKESVVSVGRGRKRPSSAPPAVAIVAEASATTAAR